MFPSQCMWNFEQIYVSGVLTLLSCFLCNLELSVNLADECESCRQRS